MAYLPGVTGDDLTPGGLVIEGGLLVGDASFVERIPGLIQARLVRGDWFDDGTGGADCISGNTNGDLLADSEGCSLAGVRNGAVGAFAFQEAVVYAQDSSDGPTTDLLYQGYNHGASVFKVNKAGGVGRFGTAAPTAASAITGALSAVTDTAAKDVLTSIIAALIADGGATNGTT